jgi:single-strand DNA-binding protein
VVEQYCRKGSLICVEGKLKLDTWDDKTSGQKRQKHMIVAEAIQLLETRAESEARQGRTGGAPTTSSRSDMGGYSGSQPPEMHDEPQPVSGGGGGEEIPF